MKRVSQQKIYFFHANTAKLLKEKGIQADLIAANNVLAHVPDIQSFVAGFKILLKPEGVITFEFPHLMQMLKHAQFDTVYHEHFSYLSLTALQPIFDRHELKVVDYNMLPTHGGSLRLYVEHDDGKALNQKVVTLLRNEESFGIKRLETYQTFRDNALHIKSDLLEALHVFKRRGKRVAAYGAPAKGNTLLNYCGITTDLIAYTVDRNPEKQTRYCLEVICQSMRQNIWLEDKPDIVLILPWNICQ